MTTSADDFLDGEETSSPVVIGAPGTTKTDLEEGTSNLKLEPIKHGKVVTELQDDSKQVSADAFLESSADDFLDADVEDTAQYGDRAWLHTNTPYGATEKNIVAGTDMVLTLPVFFAKMGLSGLSDIAHTVAGSDAPMQETDKLLANMDKTQFGRFLNAPLATIMKEGFNKDTSNSGVEHVMSAIMQPFMDAETHWQKESGQNLSGLGTRMANITMAKGLEVTGKGIKKGYEKLDPAGAKERAAIKEYDKKAKAKEILKQAEESSKAILSKELGRTATPEEHMSLVRLMANEHASEADVGNYIETLKKKDVSVDEQIKAWEQEVTKEQAEAKLGEEVKTPVEDTPTTAQEALQGVKEGEVIPEPMPDGSLPTAGKPTNIHNLGVAEQVAETVNKPPLARTTKEGKVIVDEVAAKADFDSGFKYIFEADSPTGKQKKVVFEQLGLTKDQFKAQVKTPEDYNTFLKAHEESHVANNDRASYPRKEDGKLDLMHPKAIEIEARATQDGLAALQTKVPKAQAGNIDPKLAIGMGAVAAGAVAGSIIADDNKVLGGVLGAAVGGLGAAFKLSKKGGGTNPLNKVYNLPDVPPVRDLSKGAPHPAAMVSEKDFQATGKEVLRLHGPEAAKEFARKYQEYRAKNYVKVPEQMEDLPDALYNVDTKEKLNDSELVKALEMSEQAGFTTDLRSSLYEALDKGQPLTSTQQFQFDKFVKPLLDELAALHSKTGTGTVIPVNTSNFFGYLPRIRVWTPSTAKERLGKVWDDMTRTEGAFAQKMNESPDGLMERNIFVHEDINGKRTVVQARGEDFLFKLEKEDPTVPKPEPKTRDKPKQKVESVWKVGDVIPAGKVRGLKNEGRLVEAKVYEIEATSDLKYSKDILLNVLVRRNELLKLDREKTFLREFASSKQFDSIGKDIINRETGKVNELPVGWKIPQHIDRIPELAGKAFDPKIAAILEDWAKTYEKSMYLNLTSALIKNMMLNPIPHIANEVMHLVNIRGVSGWTTGIPAYVRSARKGASDVLGQSKNYQDVLREGGSLLSADVRNKQAIRDLFDKEAKKAFNDPLVQRDVKTIAAQIGVKPIEVYNAISKFSNKWMWTTRDMMYMGLVREAQAKYPGKPLKEIIYEIERHMPAYRLPSEIAGSRTLSKFVGNPNISVFSRYHYGMVKSLLETGKDLKPQNLKTKEGRDKFKHGANAAVMIAISYGILYPLADEIAKEMFSDLENVEQRRAGPYHLIHAGVEVIEGKKDPQAILAPIYTVNPMLLWGTQLVANRELYSGKQIYHPNDTSGMIAESLGKYAGKAIPQYTPMNQALSDDSGEGTQAFLARQIDIKSKTKEQARRAATMKYYAERDRLVRQAKERAGK